MCLFVHLAIELMSGNHVASGCICDKRVHMWQVGAYVRERGAKRGKQIKRDRNVYICVYRQRGMKRVNLETDGTNLLGKLMH